ncbi:MAG: phosphodiesterase [Pseudomonadota bacterium]|nr:phosphodiesterase [Pseudomonadota bacterium]
MLIAHLSDCHIDKPDAPLIGGIDTAERLAAAVDHINFHSPRPDAVLIAGDLSNDGTAESYDVLADIIGRLTVPVFAVPGNHDRIDHFRKLFEGASWLPGPNLPINFAVEDFPVRLIGIDTSIPGEPQGEIDFETADWLDKTLAERPDTPTLILMHHPPITTGMVFMDMVRAYTTAPFVETLLHSPQVMAILCGHLHRTTIGQRAGVPIITAPCTGHPLALDLIHGLPPHWTEEPPGYLLHLIDYETGGMVTHTAALGDFGHPQPFSTDS